MDEQRTPERPDHERPQAGRQPEPAGEVPPMPPVPGPPAHPVPADAAPAHPAAAHLAVAHPAPEYPVPGGHRPMPAPWPPAAPYGTQQHAGGGQAYAQSYGVHPYAPQAGGLPVGQAGAQPGAHVAAQRRGVPGGIVAGVTVGAMALGLIVGGGGVALYQHLTGDGAQSSTQNAAFDQGQGSGGWGSGSDGSGSGGSGPDGSGSDGSGSDGSGVSPFSGGGSSDGGSSEGDGGFGGWVPQGGRGGDQSGSQQTTTTPTSAQATGVVMIDTVLGYQGAKAAGTGMVLTSDGLVLTNNHVVEGSTSITVTIGATGREYQAEVVGTDKSKDVALLQLKDASGLATVTLDDDEGVTSGDDVTAVGNAQGQGSLVAAPGSVTATDQSMTASTESSSGSETLSGLIEFSAAVVSGDSGGPLLDSEGEVVGMTTAASTGGSSVVAYAIDITDALAIAHRIDAGQAGDGIVIGTPAFLGVAFSSGSSSGGATVQQVLSGTPAAKAGIAAGDTITGVGGKSVDSADALSERLSAYSPGDKVTVTWVSGETGETRSATVTLMAGPAA